LRGGNYLTRAPASTVVIHKPVNPQQHPKFANMVKNLRQTLGRILRLSSHFVTFPRAMVNRTQHIYAVSNFDETVNFFTEMHCFTLENPKVSRAFLKLDTFS